MDDHDAEFPDLNQVPLAEISIHEGSLVVLADDALERRVKITFEPIQAMRWTTEDAVRTLEPWLVWEGAVGEVGTSPWVAEIRKQVSQHDKTATFMDKARHFVMNLYSDGLLEVAAWSADFEWVKQP